MAQKVLKIENDKSNHLWNKFISNNRFVQTDVPVFDFTDCSFIEPSHLVLLACLAEEYFVNGTKITFLAGKNHAIIEYLTKIHFFDFWKPKFNRSSFTQISKSTNLALWKLNPVQLSPYVVWAKEYFEKNFSPNTNFDVLNICLAEIFNNIIDHSKTKISGFTTSQFYPTQKKLKIAVCDFGYGIPVTVNNYLNLNSEKPLSSVETLRLAFEKNFSTKSTPQNRGFGLDTLSSIVKHGNGKLRLISDDAMLKIEDGKTVVFSLKHRFAGAHFEIILDTTCFDEKENDTFVDEFSF